MSGIFNWQIKKTYTRPKIFKNVVNEHLLTLAQHHDLLKVFPQYCVNARVTQKIIIYPNSIKSMNSIVGESIVYTNSWKQYLILIISQSFQGSQLRVSDSVSALKNIKK